MLFGASCEESGCGVMVWFSISSQPQASGSPRSQVNPKRWIRDVPDRCAMGQHVSTSICICGRLKQPKLLSSCFLMEEKTGCCTGTGTRRVFV